MKELRYDLDDGLFFSYQTSVFNYEKFVLRTPAVSIYALNKNLWEPAGNYLLLAAYTIQPPYSIAVKVWNQESL